MKHLFSRTKDFKGKVAIRELKMAHLVIVILSLALAALLIMQSSIYITLDKTLSATAAVLLVLVALTSASIIFALRNK